MLSREVLATGEDENSSLAARAAAASQGAGLGDGEGLAEVAGLADPVDTAGGGTSESMWISAGMGIIKYVIYDVLYTVQ